MTDITPTQPGRPEPSRSRGSNTILIILATIGVLSLMTMLAFFGLGAMIIKGLSGSGDVTVVDGGPKVGVIHLKGVITESEPAIRQMLKFSKNPDVKAIVMRIDSPGGAVGASQELFQEIRELDTKKPVVVSMGSVAASGGYYAALGAGTIVANPGTITGSIGVIMKIPDLQKLMEKVGIGMTVIKSGKLKDLGAINRPLTPEEKAILENVMDDIHEQFMADVASSRGIPLEKVREIADGRIISGRQAKKLGLVDELGNFHTAVLLAADAAGIKGEPNLLYPEKDKLMMLRKILEDGGAGTIARGIRKGLMDSDAGMVTCR